MTLIVIGLIFLAITGYAVSGFIIMFLWNLLAGYFGFVTINFWIGLAISFVLSIIGKIFKNN